MDYGYVTDAEQHVIGCLLYEPDLIEDFWLKPEHFTPGTHFNLVYTILDLHKKSIPVDLVTITERVGAAKLQRIGGIEYMQGLAMAIATTSNFEHHQGIILKSWKRRELKRQAKLMESAADGDDVDGAIRGVVDSLVSLEDMQKKQEHDGHIKNYLIQLNERLEQSGGEVTGVETGFRDLDRLTQGWQPTDFVIVAARPSMGKTAFALNTSRGAANNNHKVGIVSAEMPGEQLAGRKVSASGNIDGTKIRQGFDFFDAKDFNSYHMALGELSNQDIHIFDDSGINTEYIRQKVRFMRRTYPEDKILIIVDYLQLIEGTGEYAGNRQQEVGLISRQLKGMAKEYNVTMMALSQLSRANEGRQDKRPMMSDLRESGQIEQDADLIGFLHRDDYYDAESENQNIIEFILRKHRNGPVGTVELAFVKEYNKFIDLDHRYSDDNVPPA